MGTDVTGGRIVEVVSSSLKHVAGVSDRVRWWKGRRLPPWAALAISFALVALFCEFAAFVVFKVTSPYHDLSEYLLRHSPHEIDPYRVIRLNPNHRSNGVVHNAQGFRRSADVSKRKAPNTIRIFLMGASTAYGTGPPPPFRESHVTNEETLDARLESLLGPRFPGMRIEVINAGVAGYRVYSHWTYLNQVILDYDPDIVMFLDGNNDHYHAEESFEEFAFDHLALEAMNRPSFRSAIVQFFRFAAQHSYALSAIETRVRRLLDETLAPKGYARRLYDSDRFDEHLLDVYRSTARRSWASIVRQNCRLLQDRHVRAVVMLQPELQFAQSKPMTEEEQRLAALDASLRVPRLREFLNFVRPVTVELLNEAVAGTDATFIDLTDPFGGMHEQAYLDFCHLSAAGYRALALYLLPRLEPIIENVSRERGLGDHG
jgi:lysophospholipase L1-like esterase